LDNLTTHGNFVVRVVNPYVGGYEDVTITPVTMKDPNPPNGTGWLGVLDVDKTATAIRDGLDNAIRLGVNWPLGTRCSRARCRSAT